MKKKGIEWKETREKELLDLILHLDRLLTHLENKVIETLLVDARQGSL